MKSNYKVLFVTFEYKKTVSGGIGRVINGIISHLREKSGVDVFHIRWKTKFMKLAGDHYYMAGEKELCEKYPTMYRALIKVLQDHQYDIIHVLHVGLETTKMARIIKEKFPRVQIIFSCHSLAPQDSEIRMSNPKKMAFEEEIIKKCDAIHVLNKTSLNLLKQHYPWASQSTPVFMIPNGINKADYDYKPSKIESLGLLKTSTNKRINITCMSRWTFGKGLEHFLNAVPIIIEKASHVKFTIAGRKNISWENNYFQYVLKIDAMARKLKKHVKIMGWLNDVERNRLFAQSDICIMPSELEYFPYSLLEPMITKVPVVASDIDCVSETFSNNEECLLFENTNHYDLADKVLELIFDENKRYTLQESAYKKVSTEFQWHYVANQYHDMYQNVVRQDDKLISTSY